MTLHEQLLILNTIIKDKANIPNLEWQEFADLTKSASISLFEKILKTLKQEAKQYNIKEREHIAQNEDLRPFKVQSDVSLTTGVGTLPSNYVYALGMNGVYNTSNRDIEIIDEDEKNFRIGNILSIVEDFPISVIDTSVRVWPTNITTINLQYIKKPTPPVYVVAYNSTSGLNQYSVGSSTEYEWDEHNHIDLLMEILGMLNISVGLQDVKKYLQK